MRNKTQTSERSDRSPKSRKKTGDHYSRAVVLARKAKYDAAAKQLGEALLENQCTEAEALDLRARMYAQQGMLLDAERCWRKALQLDSSNESYSESVKQLRRCFSTKTNLPRYVAYAASAIAILLLSWQVMVVNPAVESGQERLSKAIYSVAENMKGLASESEMREHNLASEVAVNRQNLQAAARELSEALSKTATSAETAENRLSLDGIRDRLTSLESENKKQIQSLRVLVDERISQFGDTVFVLEDKIVKEISELKAALAEAVDFPPDTAASATR